MARALVLALALAAAGCASVEPEDPPLIGGNKMKVQPGLLSGPYDEFVIVGDHAARPGALAEENIGAGS